MAAIRRAVILILLSVPSVYAAPADAAPADATLAGAVTDDDTEEPLARALVALPELERAVITGADGRYRIQGVPSGPQHITVRLIGYAPRTLHALVPREGILEINVSLRSQPFRLRSFDVQGPIRVRGLEQADSTALPDREMSIASVRNHPLLTEPDVFQALESGEVVLRPETPSGAHVRGGSTEHLAYLIDGIPVFSPYHTAGISSAWNPDALSRLRLRSADLSTTNPHTLTGSLDAVTRSPGERIGARGSFSATQARVTVDGPLGRGHAGYLVAARTGFAGLLTRKKESSHLRGDTGDWLAKLELPIFKGRMRFLGYASINEIDAAATSGAEAVMGEPMPRNTFDWRSRSAGAEWRRSLRQADIRIMGWSAAGDADVDWRALAGPVRLASDRRDVGLLAGVERRSPRGALRAGLRLERVTTSYHVLADSAGGLEWALDARTRVATAFGGVERRLLPRVILGAGASLASAAQEWYASPRAMLRWNPSSRLTVTGSYARAHQFQQSLRNPESVVGTIFPVDLHVGVGAPGIPAAKSDQGVIAADLRPASGVRLSLQGYTRRADRLVLVAPRSGEPFALGSFTVGAGTARGLALDAGMSTARFALVASYGFQRVRLEYGDSSYVPEHGARHLLQGGVIAYPASTLSVRIGTTAVWGRRTTTASGDFEWEACNLLDRGCEFGGSPHYVGDPLGGTELSPYYRFDMGVRQHWHFEAGGRDVSVALFAAVTNLLGRKNILTYSRQTATEALVAIEMRPRSPLVVGLDWSF